VTPEDTGNVREKTFKRNNGFSDSERGKRGS
jgi:hypothetical protein